MLQLRHGGQWMDLKNMKSLWQDRRSSSTWSFICPICKLKRQLPFHPKPGQPIHFFQVGLTSAVFTILTWNWFTWKGWVSFVPLWITFEVIYRWRTRALLACKHCGFDPYLYLIDPELAKKEIEDYWKKKFEEKGLPYPSSTQASPQTMHQLPKKPPPHPTEKKEPL